MISSLQSNRNFDSLYKKLHNNQKVVIDLVLKEIASDPFLGEAKVGDLAGVYTYKFQCINQLFLVAYEYEYELDIVFLIHIGTHENFYRDLKKVK